MPEINDVLVPPKRLGALLRESRVAAGEHLTDVAARSRKLTLVDLEDLELGRSTLDDETLREVIDIYGVEGVGLIPQRSRLTIDLDEGMISVDTTHLPVDAGNDPDAVLVRYLALVHRLRGQSVGTAVKIREIDVGVLAEALELDDDEIERRLQRLMSDSDPVKTTEHALRRRLLVPLAGVVVATTAAGVLVLVADDTADVGTGPEVMVSIDAGTQIGDAALVESPTSDRSNGQTSTGQVTPAVPMTDIGEPAVVERPTTTAAPAAVAPPSDEIEPAPTETAPLSAAPAAAPESTDDPATAVSGTDIGTAAIIERGGEQTTRG